MDLPIPRHLQNILIPIGNENDEFEVTGKIQCACHSEDFAILESNEKHIVNIICKQCGKEYVLFDAGKHGWNGFVCEDDFYNRELPYKKVSSSVHNILVSK